MRAPSFFRFSTTSFGVLPTGDSRAVKTSPAIVTPSTPNATSHELAQAAPTPTTPQTMRERIASIQGRMRFMAPEEAFGHYTACLQTLFAQAQSQQDIEALMTEIDPALLSRSPALLLTVAQRALAMTTVDTGVLKEIALMCLQGALDSGDADVQQAMWNTISQLSWRHPNEGANALMACLDEYQNKLQVSTSTKDQHERVREILRCRATAVPGAKNHQAMAWPSAFNQTSVPPPLPKELWFLIAGKLVKGTAPGLLWLYSTAAALATIRRLQKAHGKDLQGRINEVKDTWIRGFFEHNLGDASRKITNWNPDWPTQQSLGAFFQSHRTAQYTQMQTYGNSPEQLVQALPQLLEEAMAVQHYRALSRLPLDLLAVAQQDLHHVSLAQLTAFAATVSSKLSAFHPTVQRSILLNLICLAPSFLETALAGLTEPQDIALARRLARYHEGMQEAPPRDVDDFLSHMEATPVEQAGEPLYVRLLTLIRRSAKLDEVQQQRMLACYEKAVDFVKQIHLPW